MELAALARVLRGFALYRRIARAHGGRSGLREVFLCPYPGTGDTYMAGLYLREYLARNGIGDDGYALLANGEAALRVLRLFPIKNAAAISESQKDDLLAAYQLMHPERMRLKPLLFWDWRVRRHANISRLPITFDDSFRYDVFRLDESAARSAPEFSAGAGAVGEFFGAHGLKMGRTVVLSPYMGLRMFELPMAIWAGAASRLAALGYSVCTNSAGDDEPPVPGTEAVFFPFSAAVPIMDAAGCFVGLRSGLCDVISSSECRMVVIYETATEKTPLRYFGLKNMGLNERAIELEYDGSDDAAFEDLIVRNACGGCDGDGGCEGDGGSGDGG
jgi:hypothetical protein